MKKLLLILAFPIIASAADKIPKNEWNPAWQDPSKGFILGKNVLGSGQPARSVTEGVDVAVPVADGYYHVPGFLPGHPTAATIYPQVQTVDCHLVGGRQVCDGYQVNRSVGHGEYLYVVPRLVAPPPEPPSPKMIFYSDPPPPYTPAPVKKPRKKVVKKVLPPPVCK